MTVIDGDITYVPFTTENTAGFRVTHISGKQEYIVLHPGTRDGDEPPAVHLYQGVTGDPKQDECSHYYEIFAGAPLPTMVEVSDLYEQCSFPVVEQAIAMSDCCRTSALSAVVDQCGHYRYRCAVHRGLVEPGREGRVVYAVPRVK